MLCWRICGHQQLWYLRRWTEGWKRFWIIAFHHLYTMWWKQLGPGVGLRWLSTDYKTSKVPLERLSNVNPVETGQAEHAMWAPMKKKRLGAPLPFRTRKSLCRGKNPGTRKWIQSQGILLSHSPSSSDWPDNSSLQWIFITMGTAWPLPSNLIKALALTRSGRFSLVQVLCCNIIRSSQSTPNEGHRRQIISFSLMLTLKPNSAL